MLLSVEYMHIPDGFLSIFVSFVAWIISIAMVAVAIHRVGKELGERQVPMMGVLAAAIFAGQMLNFAVAGGTSGHLMGSALATILMGPWAAILIMTSVVSIQALIFQDGGLIVLGANIFNMAILGVAVAYLVYRSGLKIIGNTRRGVLVSGFSAAWISIFIAALSVALQLALSGTSPVRLAIPAMAGVHALIGIGEGLITVGALVFLMSVRPGVIRSGETSMVGDRFVMIIGLLLAVLLVIAAPLASAKPDGLEWVAMQGGFISQAGEPLYQIIPDYLLPGVANESIATIAAGLLGVVIMLGIAFGFAYSRRMRHISGR